MRYNGGVGVGVSIESRMAAGVCGVWGKRSTGRSCSHSFPIPCSSPHRKGLLMLPRRPLSPLVWAPSTPPTTARIHPQEKVPGEEIYLFRPWRKEFWGPNFPQCTLRGRKWALGGHVPSTLWTFSPRKGSWKGGQEWGPDAQWYSWQYWLNLVITNFEKSHKSSIKYNTIYLFYMYDPISLFSNLSLSMFL